MEFDSLFIQLQGILSALERQLGSLKITPVDESDAEKVFKSLDKLIEPLSSKPQAAESLRRIHMYLVVNSEFSALELLSEDDDYCSIVNTAPTLSTELLAMVVRRYHMIPFACEVLSYCEPILSIQYLAALQTWPKSTPAVQIIEESFLFASACYLRLVRLCKNIENFGPGNLSPLARKFREALKELILDIPKNINAFLQDFPSKGIEISGHLTKHSIILVRKCVEHLEHPDTPSWYPHSSLDHDYSSWGEDDKTDLMACFDFIVGECRKNIEEISVTLWMEWDDYSVDAEDKTLQKSIAEEAYSCLNKETSISTSSFITLKGMLMGFERKPLDETDEINSATIPTILANIPNKTKTQVLWIEALFSRQDGLSSNEALVVVKEHLRLFSCDLTAKLMQKAIEGGTEDDVFLKDMAFEAFQKATLTDQHKLLEAFFTENGVTEFFKTPSFDKYVTSVLNRAANHQTNKEKWMAELLLLCVQSPSTVLERIVTAGVASRGQANVMSATLKDLRELCLLRPCKDPLGANLLLQALSSAMNTLNPATSQLTHLVIQLEQQGLLVKADFLRGCLLPALKQDVTDYRVPHIQLWLQCLKRLLRVDSTEENLRPNPCLNLASLLAVLADVLQRASWVLGKFRQQESLLRAETVQLVRPLACRMANTCDPEDNDLLWLRSALLKLTSHNRSHFSPLWTHFNLPVPSMSLGALLLSRDALCQHSNMPPGGPDQLLSPLLILLPTCCTPEWRLLSSNLSLLLARSSEEDDPEEGAQGSTEEQALLEVIRLLVTTLMLQALMLAQQQQPDDQAFSSDCAMACLENGVRNLGIVIKEEWLPRLTSSGAVEAGTGLVRQVALLLRALPSTLAGSCSLALSGILLAAQEALLRLAAPRPDLAAWCAHELALSMALLPDRESRQALSCKLLLEPAVAQM